MRTISLRSLLAVTAALSAISIAAPAVIAAQSVGSPQQLTPAASTTVAVKAKKFANCTALNKVYAHGVGKPDAVDHVSGHTKKVTNFYPSLSLYKANKGSDRDKDGIACEKL